MIITTPQYKRIILSKIFQKGIFEFKHVRVLSVSEIITGNSYITENITDESKITETVTANSIIEKTVSGNSKIKD